MLRWSFRSAAVLWLALVVPALAEESEPKALLARIRAVGREGAGNVEAARAWKTLVARGPAVLPDLLGAMDDDNLTVTNWVRAAVDTVAESAVKAGKPLPAAELEKFIADTSHSACARRLAYEWLVRIDAKTPQRLLPTMLRDPSPELRRDAVAAVETEAKALLAKDDKKGARTAFRTAFDAACDQDQVDALADRLKDLGEVVDKAAHFGVVRRWHLLASFDNHNGVGFEKVYPPEKGVDLSAGYRDRDDKEIRWKEQETANPYGELDLNKVIGKDKGAVAYAFAVIESPRKRTIQVRVGCINAVKVFLNGKEIFDREEYHHGMKMDQYTARGTLEVGRNELLLKVCQNEQKENWAQDWKFQARLCDFTGSAIRFNQPGKPARKE
jgi:hypothetical protein